MKPGDTVIYQGSPHVVAGVNWEDGKEDDKGSHIVKLRNPAGVTVWARRSDVDPEMGEHRG